MDDAPYGGGPGMVMRPQVWGEALDAVVGADPRPPRLVVPTPAGRPFTQATARAWAGEERLVFACGRYEGIDQRVVDDAAARMPVDEVSIGDYVLVGGEAAVLVMVEAVVRLVPGVLGNPASAEQDSFSDGLLEGPSYTRPEIWRGRAVPEVLRAATTPRSPAGGATAPWNAPRPAGPTCSPRCPRTRSTSPTARCWPARADSRPVPPGPFHPAPGRLALWTGCRRPNETSGAPGADPLRVVRRPSTIAIRRGRTPMNTLDALDAQTLRSDIPAFRPGDTLKVHVKVIEGSRSRVQVFQGVVIRRQGAGARETFTVRKVSFGVGVERTFPVHSPNIDRIELFTRGDVRRAKLYYLRELRGKAAKIKEKREAPSRVLSHGWRR